MKHALRSELLKLLTVRSTYVTIILASLYVAFMSFYVEGYWGGSGSAAGALGAAAYTELIRNIILGTWLFPVAVAVLSIAHEYRHNTITYTLTAINSRTKVMLAKIGVVAGFGVLFSLFIIGFGLLTYRLGVAMRGGDLAPQVIDWLPTLSKGVFYVTAYSLLALLVGFLVRSIVASILIIMIGLNLVETLAGLLLKDNAKFLPLTALQNVLNTSEQNPGGAYRPLYAALIFCFYLLVGWAVAWWLFKRRDAS